MWNAIETHNSSKRHAVIMSMAKNSEYISRADVVRLLHVKEAKAYVLLKSLVEGGKQEPVNKGRYVKYRICNSR